MSQFLCKCKLAIMKQGFGPTDYETVCFWRINQNGQNMGISNTVMSQTRMLSGRPILR
jgi:hypothetical protein